MSESLRGESVVVPYAGYIECQTCGLHYAETLSHGMVDCVTEFRWKIARQAAETSHWRLRAATAEATLAEVRRAVTSS